MITIEQLKEAQDIIFELKRIDELINAKAIMLKPDGGFSDGCMKDFWIDERNDFTFEPEVMERISDALTDWSIKQIAKLKDMGVQYE